MTTTSSGTTIDATNTPRADLARLGEPRQYRIWSTAPRSPLNAFRRREFRGWLVGWGDGDRDAVMEEISMDELHTINARTEVTVFLTTDGRLITTVNLVLGETRLVFESAPDHWAMYCGDHGTLEGVASWLDRVRRELAPAISPEALAAALDQAERVVSGAHPTESTA